MAGAGTARDLRARGLRQARKDRLRRPVDQRVAVAQRDRKAHPHAHVGGGPRHLRRLAREVGQSLHAGIVHHHHAGAAAGAAGERDRARQIGVDGRNEREVVQPGFERLAAGAERARPHRAGVVVGIHQRRQRQHRLGRPMAPARSAAIRATAASAAKSACGCDPARSPTRARARSAIHASVAESFGMRSAFGGRNARLNTSLTAGLRGSS